MMLYNPCFCRRRWQRGAGGLPEATNHVCDFRFDAAGNVGRSIPTADVMSTVGIATLNCATMLSFYSIY